MTPADFLSWLGHLLAFHPFPPRPPGVVRAIQVSLLTIPLKECCRRIAWPYSRVLWPPPWAACGERGQAVSARARRGHSEGKAFLEDTLQRKDPWRSSRGIHSRSEWPAYRRGATGRPQPCNILGRGWMGPNLFSRMAPAQGQQKPRAVLSEKHVDETGTAYLPLKLLRSVQWERETNVMWLQPSDRKAAWGGGGQGISYTPSVPCGLFKAPVSPTRSLKWVLFALISPVSDGSDIQVFKGNQWWGIDTSSS